MVMRFLLYLAVVLATGSAGGALADVPKNSPRGNGPRLAAEPPAWLGVGFNGNSRVVVINEVIRDTPADIAGLTVNDVITGINDKAVRSGDELIREIKAHRVGDRVKVSIRRGASPLHLWTELTGKLEPSELIQRRLVDTEAIDFALPRLHGTHIGDLKELRGKVVVLEFWSTTCKGCPKTLEPLASFEAEHAGDVAVLLITPESNSAIQSYLKTYTSAQTILQDASGRLKMRYRCELSGPTVVVVGRDGIVRHADTGPDLNIHDLLLEAKRAVRERSSI
jgi:peroxiredoxin